MRMIVILLCWCCLFTAQVHSAAEEHPFPQCLGPVCLQDILADAEPFFERYGKGLADEGKFPVYLYTAAQGAHVKVERYHGENRPINLIAVSVYPFAEHASPPPDTPFPPLETEQGIGLGASFEAVMQAYGKPNYLKEYEASYSSSIPEFLAGTAHGKLVIADYQESEEYLCKEFAVVFEDGLAVMIVLTSPPG